MKADPVQRIYRIHAHFYDWTRWAFLFGRRAAAAALAPPPGGAVLEIGCGTGLNFRSILRHLGPDGRLTGLDFSAPMLVKARKRIARRRWKNVLLARGDASRIRFRRSFDAVLFAYSLTMIPDWERALALACEHLAPGGRLVVLDFATFGGWGPLGLLLRSWLRLHHVETAPPYIERLRTLLPDLAVRHFLGQGYFVAAGTKPGDLESRG